MVRFADTIISDIIFIFRTLLDASVSAESVTIYADIFA